MKRKPEPIDMSPPAIAQRLEAIRRLCDLTSYLAQIRPLIEAAESQSGSGVGAARRLAVVHEPTQRGVSRQVRRSMSSRLGEAPRGASLE